MSENIKNIIFDYGGILTGFDRSTCINAFNKIGARCIAQYVVDKRQEDLFYDIEIGNISTQEFCSEVRRMSGSRAGDEEIISAWNVLLAGIPGEKVRMLSELSGKYNLYMLSNTNEMHWNYSENKLFPEAGIDTSRMFKSVYLSYKMKMLKPSAEIFDAVIKDAAINARETLFIDDSDANCRAAESVGIKALCAPNGNEWMTVIKDFM